MTSHLMRIPDPRRARALLRAAAVCVAGFCVTACIDRLPPSDGCSTEDDAPASTEPLPDLGPDAVVCGEPEDFLSTQEDIAGLAGCQIFRGSLRVKGLDLSPLSSLRVVEGRLDSGYDLEMEALTGLEQLEAVGEFSFRGDALRDFEGVRNLRDVDGLFSLQGMRQLSHLDGLEHLQTTGDLQLLLNPELVSIDALSGLREVNGHLTILDNPELTGLGCLPSLERVSGNLVIGGNPKVPAAHIDGLLRRIEVGGEVRVD